jgi:hypothetical protein
MIDIESLFRRSDLFETYSNYNAIWQRNPQFPYFNYFGINFDSGGIVSVKFYFHVFNKVILEDAKCFLPTLTDFNEFYQLYDESCEFNINQTGCAFELKFFKDGSVVKGFHMRLRPDHKTYEKIGAPLKIPLEIDRFGLNPGIAFEYSANTVSKKVYYYFDDQEHKDRLADVFNLSVLRSTSLIEYSESEKFYKINTWYDNPIFHSQANIFSKNHKNVIERLCEKYGLKAKIYGYYNDLSIKSVYFFNSQPERSRQSNAENQIYTDTLLNILEPS